MSMGVLLNPSRSDPKALYGNLSLPSHFCHSWCYVITFLIFFPCGVSSCVFGFFNSRPNLRGDKGEINYIKNDKM